MSREGLFRAIICVLMTVLVSGVVFGAETVFFDVESAAYRITPGESGEVIRMDGFKTNGAPGAPLLPRKVFDVALPPSVNWDSLVVRAQETVAVSLDGTHDIQPAGPDIA